MCPADWASTRRTRASAPRETTTRSPTTMGESRLAANSSPGRLRLESMLSIMRMVTTVPAGIVRCSCGLGAGGGAEEEAQARQALWPLGAGQQARARGSRSRSGSRCGSGVGGCLRSHGVRISLQFRGGLIFIAHRLSTVRAPRLFRRRLLRTAAVGGATCWGGVALSAVWTPSEAGVAD